MIVANLLGKVDVTATSKGSGGATALPRAVRHGAALCIAALHPQTMEPLRLGMFCNSTSNVFKFEFKLLILKAIILVNFSPV